MIPICQKISWIILNFEPSKFSREVKYCRLNLKVKYCRLNLKVKYCRLNLKEKERESA